MQDKPVEDEGEWLTLDVVDETFTEEQIRNAAVVVIEREESVTPRLPVPRKKFFKNKVGTNGPKYGISKQFCLL